MGAFSLCFCIRDTYSHVLTSCCSEPNLKTVRELIYKRGYGKVNKQRVPLASNAVIEQTLAGAIAERTGIDPEVSFYPQALAATACTLLRAAVLRWQAGGGSSALGAGALVELVAEAFGLLADGMATPVVTAGGR